MHVLRMWRFVLALIVGCSGETPDTPGSDAGSGSGSDAARNPDGGGGLVPGSLSVQWMHGSASCASNTDPELQEHAYNATTIIYRQNKCDTFEAPFIYLLVGETSALLLDSGATNTSALRTAVRAKIGTKELLVAHTHSHGDHIAGDAQFAGQPNTRVVGTSTTAVQTEFAAGTKDLGDRVVDVLLIPGHHASHIAVYDRQTGLLFTGDTLYPGLLFVNDWTAFRASASALAQLVATHPVAHVLGAHVEMTATPRQVYPYGTTYQPDEHVLQLAAAQVTELDAALDQLGASPPAQAVAYDHFVIDPP